ncbi:Ulvan-active sulfatase [subsurface metagenome]
MNIIVICLDTLRWDAVGCYHPGWVQTPFIDHYAKKAVQFTEARCGSFPTVPMRVDAYTGNVNWPKYGWRDADPEQPKFPLLLSEAGYHTGLVLDTKNNVSAGLHKYYDEYHLIKKEIDDGVTPDMIEFPVPRDRIRQNGGGYAGQRAQWSHYKYEEDWFVARTMLRASKWLEDNAQRDNFFLWVDTFEIHEDWMPPAYYVDLYDKGYQGLDYTFPNYGYTDIYKPSELNHLRACYAGEVTLTDRWVGHLLKQIELLGLFENTSVILISDHGMYIGEYNRAGKHTVNPEDPWPIYDTVAKIPLLVWTPLSGGSKNDALVQPADIMPTVLELCGIESPETTGKSWVPLLKGEVDTCHETVYTSFYSGGSVSIPSHITLNTDQYTAIFGRSPHQPELYYRKTDPEQLRNIADENPEIVKELRNRLIHFMRQQGADKQYINTYNP